MLRIPLSLIDDNDDEEGIDCRMRQDHRTFVYSQKVKEGHTYHSDLLVHQSSILELITRRGGGAL